MTKKIKDILSRTEKLIKVNSDLQQKLNDAKKSIEAIKKGNIDALVSANRKFVKIYTEKTADKVYRILIEKMNEGAVTLDKKGTVLYCNSCFAGLVKMPLHKVIGSKFEKFIPRSFQATFADVVKRARKKPLKTELFLHTSKGKSVPVLMAITDFLLDDRYVMSIIVTDLTVQNRNQEKLKRRTLQLEEKNKELENAYKELATLTYISSHDLQEPLRKIQNFSLAILLEEERNLSVTGKGYFQKMRQTAKRMQILIEDLLSYSRTRDKNLVFEYADLNLIVAEVLKDLDADIKEKKAVINAKPLGRVKVVISQFRQLLNNLLDNSLKFSKPGVAPHIVIESEVIPGDKKINKELSSKRKYFHLIFSDNGIGFDPQYKDRIFEVFQRLHGIDKYKGTGIGLAICKRIVENHQGVIAATGKPGEGTRIDIYLPLSEEG